LVGSFGGKLYLIVKVGGFWRSQPSARISWFARKRATPEQVVLDFGLNARPWVGNLSELEFSHSVLIDLFTAKDFSSALEATIQNHETRFGTIERKR
jgi:hypothetical protein